MCERNLHCLDILYMMVVQIEWDGTVVWVLITHGCGLGSFSAPGFACGLSYVIYEESSFARISDLK